MIKKGEKINILLIVILIILIFGIAVGYAALSRTLYITGTVNIASDWNIKISNVTRSGGNGAIDNENSPSFTETTVSFDVDLGNPGSTATYTITIKNDGKIAAKLDGIEGIEVANATQPLELQFTTNANINDTLAPGSSIDYTVTIKWNPESQEIPEIKTKTATITFKYVQNT